MSTPDVTVVTETVKKEEGYQTPEEDKETADRSISSSSPEDITVEKSSSSPNEDEKSQYSVE